MRVRNPGVIAPDRIQNRGVIILFEPDDQTYGQFTQIDLGWVRDFAKDEATTDTTWTGNREGVVENVKTETTSFTKAFTFGTISSGDNDIVMLHNAAEIVKANGKEAFAMVEDVASSITGRLWVIRKTRAPGALDAVSYYHRASIRGNGTGDDNGADVLLFRVTVVGAGEFTPPAAWGDVGRRAPFGVRYLVSHAERDRLIDDLIAIGNPSDATPIQSGAAQANLAGAAGSSVNYVLTADEASDLEVKVTGGTGNVDVLVYDNAGALLGSGTAADNEETVTLTDLQPGEYTITLRGTAAYTGASLTATATAATP